MIQQTNDQTKDMLPVKRNLLVKGNLTNHKIPQMLDLSGKTLSELLQLCPMKQWKIFS